MQKGVNYPRGPLAWADAIGVARRARRARAISRAHYGEDRYRDLAAARAARGDRRPLAWREHHPRDDADADAQALAERVAAAMYARDRASQALGMRIVRRRRRDAPSSR